MMAEKNSSPASLFFWTASRESWERKKKNLLACEKKSSRSPKSSRLREEIFSWLRAFFSPDFFFLDFFSQRLEAGWRVASARQIGETSTSAPSLPPNNWWRTARNRRARWEKSPELPVRKDNCFTCVVLRNTRKIVVFWGKNGILLILGQFLNNFPRFFSFVVVVEFCRVLSVLSYDKNLSYDKKMSYDKNCRTTKNVVRQNSNPKRESGSTNLRRFYVGPLSRISLASSPLTMAPEQRQNNAVCNQTKQKLVVKTILHYIVSNFVENDQELVVFDAILRAVRRRWLPSFPVGPFFPGLLLESCGTMTLIFSPFSCSNRHFSSFILFLLPLRVRLATNCRENDRL